MNLSGRFKRWRKRREVLKMCIAANREAEQAYLLCDYQYGNACFKRAQQLAAKYDELRKFKDELN